MENEATWKLAYWAIAWALMAAAVVSGSYGWHAARKKRFDVHAKSMNRAIIFVILFLLSYPAKLLILGREQLDSWSALARLTLHSHETAVAVMLLAGGTARWLARRMRPRGKHADALSPRGRARHRRLGRIALVASFAGLATAAVVLVGMFHRLP